jgi:hypothetical protein
MPVHRLQAGYDYSKGLEQPPTELLQAPDKSCSTRRCTLATVCIYITGTALALQALLSLPSQTVLPMPTLHTSPILHDVSVQPASITT